MSEFSNSQLSEQLVRGARAMALELSDAERTQLCDYLALLIKWNKAYNLTAIRDPKLMVPLHLLDSLAVHAHVQGAQRLIDVGTGAGLPGVVLAIMNPDKDITLLDSNGKKTRFLFTVKTALGLDNVSIVNARVESYQPECAFDMVLSRAFASLYDMTHWCQHLRAKDGCFLAMKGQYPHDEIDMICDRFQVADTRRLSIPDVEGERHLLRLVPLAE